MKEILISSIFFLTFVLPLHVSAADKTITIQWTIPTRNEADIQTYIVKYSPSSDMRGAESLTCDTMQQTDIQAELTSIAMTCYNVPFVKNLPVYFTLEAEDVKGSSFVSDIFRYMTISPVQGFRIASVINAPAPSLTKLNWPASSDDMYTPVEKTAKRLGLGQYITTGCVQELCYDNIDTANNVSIAIIDGDILDQNEFEIELYFNPQNLSDYASIFGIGSDNTNNHRVHMYKNGKLYCRTILNGYSYYGYILNSDSILKSNSWYKLRYSYSKTNGYIKVYINNELKLEFKTKEVMQGEATHIYFASNYNGKERADILLDEITIK